jgi:hypothetical protein
MVNILPAELKDPVTPEGKPPEVIKAPLAPLPTWYVILLKPDELTHTAWLVDAGDEVRVIVAAGFTVIVPFKVAAGEHPPVVFTTKGNVPAMLAVPLIVKTVPDKVPVMPPGSPVAVAPVALAPIV